MHIAHGLNWCGQKTKKGSVFFIAGEGGAGLYRRIEAWHIAKNLTPESCNLLVCPSPIALNESQNATKIVELIKEHVNKVGTPSLIVIDTLSQNFSGEENSSSDIAEYLRVLNSEVRESFVGSSILLTHHTGHNQTDRMRGASSLLANVDFVYKMQSAHLSCSLEAKKMKDYELPENIGFKLKKIDLDIDEEGYEISSLVAFHENNSHFTSKPKNQKYGKHSANFLMAINQLDGCGVYSAICEKFIELSDPSLNRESKMKAFKRELENQIEIGTVIEDSGLIKLTPSNLKDSKDE